MNRPAPSFRPRPSGGFSQGFGSFSDEHLDENALQAASQQKSLTQQQSNTVPQSGKGGTNPLTPPSSQPAQPREVGSLTDELVTRPAKDVVVGLKSIVDINDLLGIKATDTPEQQTKKKQLHQRHQQLTEDEKQEAKKQFDLRTQQKKREKEEEEAKKQREEQEKQQQPIAPPAGPQKGPVGPGMMGKSKKMDAVARLQQQRQQLSNPGAQH